MKFIAILLLSVLFTVSVGMMAKKIRLKRDQTLVSPMVSGVSASNTSSATTPTNTSISNWQVFVNNYYGYKIKHPSDVILKNKTNGDISLQKSKSINLAITQYTLNENDTLNTFIEKAIDTRKSEFKDKFKLINMISPIALGSVTGQTYTVEENGQLVSFYYVPQEGNKFLLITNSSPKNNSSDYLDSENIIYSIEPLP